MISHVISIHFPYRCRWLIGKDDPMSYDLLSLPGWTFIHPMAYSRLYPSLPDEALYKEPNLHELLVFNDHALLETDALVFLSTVHTDSDNFNSTAFADYLTSFLAHIRYTSKQAELSTSTYTSFLDLYHDFGEERNLIGRLDPYFPMAAGSNIHYRKYNLDPAVRWDHLKKADESLANGDLPVYSTLLLDAIHAVKQHDYRRAILYSAMSIESLAAIKLDEKYKSFLDNGDPMGMIRIITIQTREGVVKKDSIYEALSSRSEFSQLLHERPLYLEKRSLRIENETLYLSAEKLYRTRNKIVHRGELPFEQKGNYFNLDWHSALFAIGCARDVFKWFGITEEYFMPLDNMISIDEYVLG